MNILLTSVGRRTYMVNYFKEALRGKGLVHVANSNYTYALQLADKWVLTPLIYDSLYIDFLLDYSKGNKISAIVSLFDIDLPVLALNRKRFTDAGVVLVVSDYQFVQICNDKWQTYNFLLKNGFFTPSSYLSVDDALKAIENKEIEYPLIIKPRWGMGSIGIFEAEDSTELQIFFKKTRKAIENSYLNYESRKTPDHSVIIQEKLTGEEFGLDIFNNLSGELLSIVPKRKLAIRAGETDIAEIVNDDCLLSIGKQLSYITKHIGNLDVDLFYVNNKFYILELNCRFGGQYPFSHLAGVDFPKALINLLLNTDVPDFLLTAKSEIIGAKDMVPVIINN